jgi:hypothetical protein
MPYIVKLAMTSPCISMFGDPTFSAAVVDAGMAGLTYQAAYVLIARA